METINIEIIETNAIPPAKYQRGKTSKIPDILNRIPKNKTAKIQDSETYKVATIRSFIDKQHKKGLLTNFTVQQRTMPHPIEMGKRITVAYIIHHTTTKTKK